MLLLHARGGGTFDEVLSLSARWFNFLALASVLFLPEPATGADLGGGFRGCTPVPTPPPPRDDLQLSNTTAVLQNMQICMICILSSSHYVIA